MASFKGRMEMLGHFWKLLFLEGFHVPERWTLNHLGGEGSWFRSDNSRMSWPLTSCPLNKRTWTKSASLSPYLHTRPPLFCLPLTLHFYPQDFPYHNIFSHAFLYLFLKHPFTTLKKVDATGQGWAGWPLKTQTRGSGLSVTGTQQMSAG